MTFNVELMLVTAETGRRKASRHTACEALRDVSSTHRLRASSRSERGTTTTTATATTTTTMTTTMARAKQTATWGKG